jgi:lon-related putative ATP-dependent protease
VEPVAELAPARLRRRLNAADLGFDTTENVPQVTGTVGQPRAVEALQFGLSIPTGGFNIFATGMPGSGRLFTVHALLEDAARQQPPPPDWLYVHNFVEADRPVAISVPAGLGTRLSADLDQFIAGARRQIAAALESEDFAQRRGVIGTGAERQLDEVRHEFEAKAASKGFSAQFSPTGVGIVPVIDGHVLRPDEIAGLPADRRAELDRAAGELRKELDVDLPRMRHLERDGIEALAALERDTALAAVAPLLGSLRERYAGEAAVIALLGQIENDIPKHLADLRTDSQPDPATLPGVRPLPASRDDPLARYRAHVVVDNAGAAHAPVIIATNPTYYNLSGRVEYHASFGAMVTDFSNIRAGSLHRANGGYLVIDADELLRQPYAWDALKRALRSGEVVIENLSEQMSPVPTATLHPQPIPLVVKVVLIGTPPLFQMLNSSDDDVRGLFKVRADFAPDMEWNDANVRAYAEFVSRTVTRCGLRHFTGDAVARLIEQAATIREDQRKLSTRFAEIADLAAEASYWSERNAHARVEADDVDEAIRRQRSRSNLAEERLQELIVEHTIDIETDGARVGQLNGLTVIAVGDYEFGIPARVTASISLGRGRLSSVERESKLSGPIHSKGFLILSGYLAEKYGQEQPLPIRATITFEQSYGEVEGDSASSTELYAMLSALSGLPIKQGIAVTGSVNQRGDVQAVGGVTKKLEGFFRVCAQRGLTGEQGVIIPASNVDNLMLSQEVVDAVAAGKFHVWAVKSIDEGIELLTGQPAGDPGADEYANGTVHRLIADRLREFSRRLRESGWVAEP